MTYAFTFDASACSGCKACQAACKDKNNLPVGVLWRRVYEVTGGDWQRKGEAWTNTVFAYNLSLACNHCVHPKCAGVCPTDAYVVRPDGIVYIDESKCMGCGYCAWACPYAVPQYDPDLGQMTKCNFCFDNIDAGLLPACVAACPLRVLDFIVVDDGQQAVGGKRLLWSVPASEHPFPLPNYSRTEPHLAIEPHAGMLNTLEKVVSNWEEIRPAKPKSELPLVAFTLLIQMAVGAFWSMQWLIGPLWRPVEHNFTLLRLLPSLLAGACLGVGMLAAFTHLGRKRNAILVLRNLKKSWLSRELLWAGLFGTGWAVWFILQVAGIESLLITLFVDLLGLGLIHAMSQVYRLRSVPAWNTWRTEVGFMVSSLLLGQLIMSCILAIDAYLAGSQLSFGQWQFIGWSTLTLLAMQLVISNWSTSHPTAGRLRLGLSLMGMIGTASFLIPELVPLWTSPLAFGIVLAEEALGRWLFYEMRP